METIESRSWNPYVRDCPTRVVLDLIADKWTVLIVGCLAGGTRRFGELMRHVEGISQKSLTQTLRELERNGIVARKVYASVPPRVDYSLTPLGRTLVDLLDSIQSWAVSNIEQVLVAKATYDGRVREAEDAA